MPKDNTQFQRNVRGKRGISLYFKGSQAFQVTEAVEHIFGSGSTYFVGYASPCLRHLIQDIPDTQIWEVAPKGYGATRSRPQLRVRAGNRKALLELMCINKNTNAPKFRLDLGRIANEFRVSFEMLNDAIWKKCMDSVKKNQAPPEPSMLSKDLKVESRQELEIPDDDIGDIEWLMYRGVDFDAKLRDWSVSMSTFGPRSGISDARRLKRAIMLGIETAKALTNEPRKYEGVTP